MLQNTHVHDPRQVADLCAGDRRSRDPAAIDAALGLVGASGLRIARRDRGGARGLLGHSIASAVDRPDRVTRRIGEGRLRRVRVRFDHPTSSARSAREIDHMRVLLRDKVRQLEELNRDLERKVEKRTEELRQRERAALAHPPGRQRGEFEPRSSSASSRRSSRARAAWSTSTRPRSRASPMPQTATVFAISGSREALSEGKKIPLARLAVLRRARAPPARRLRRAVRPRRGGHAQHVRDPARDRAAAGRRRSGDRHLQPRQPPARRLLAPRRSKCCRRSPRSSAWRCCKPRPTSASIKRRRS